VDILYEDYDMSAVILPTASGSPTHLCELLRGEVSRPLAIELFHLAKYHSFCGHVETNRESLRCHKDFYQSFAEQNFHDFFEDGEDTRVMDTDAVLK
jgi:hypothetical protein